MVFGADAAQKAAPFNSGLQIQGLELGTCGNESLAGFVMLELLEVVDEHLGELGSLCRPVGRASEARRASESPTCSC